MDQTLAWLETERLDLAGFLDGLSGAEWAADSLCPGWTVRDVAAHLTLSTRVTFPATVKGMIRARGDWDRMTGDMARERAARFEPADLLLIATGRRAGLTGVSGSGLDRLTAAMRP